MSRVLFTFFELADKEQEKKKETKLNPRFRQHIYTWQPHTVVANMIKEQKQRSEENQGGSLMELIDMIGSIAV